MVLREAAGPQVDLIDAAISLLERLQRSRVARDLLEAGIRLKAERLARLVERAEAEIAAALDIDRRQVLPVRGVEQEVAQAVNDARVQCLRRVGSEMAQESVGDRKNVSLSSSVAPLTAPCSLRRSVSSDTMEWPKR